MLLLLLLLFPQEPNTFEVVLATDTSRVTYVIFIYRNMSWDRLCDLCPLPVVSYADSNNVGYNYTLPNTFAASHLNQSVKVFRISDKVTTNIQEATGQEVRSQEIMDQEAIQALREMLNKKMSLQERRYQNSASDSDKSQEMASPAVEFAHGAGYAQGEEHQLIDGLEDEIFREEK